MEEYINYESVEQELDDELDLITRSYVNSFVRRTLPESTGLLKELEEYAKEHAVPIVQPEVARLLLLLGKMLKPTRILEIGTAIGYSAILLSGTLCKDGRLDTIDRYPKMIAEAKRNFERAGLTDTITLLEGDAADILPTLTGPYDLIFLDAAKGQYPEFLPQCLRLLRVGGILISDNVLYKGMVASDHLVVRRKKTIVKRLRSYLDTLCHTDGIETSLLAIGDGVAVTLKEKDIYF